MTTTNTEARKQRYVQLALGLNPMWQAPQILHLRRQLHGSKPVYQETALETGDKAKQRRLLKQQLASIQHEFWKLPIEQLHFQLQRIDVGSFPELAPLAQRLSLAASCRSDFPKLTQLDGIHLPLLNAFRTAMVLPPMEAAQVRENYLRGITDVQSLQAAKRSIAMIEKLHPHLYALEQDWFRTIMQTKDPFRLTYHEQGVVSSGPSFGLPELSWPGILVAVIALRVILRIIAMSNH